MIFDLNCRLDYTISSAATLVFNIHATEGTERRTLKEHLQLTPVLPLDSLTDADGNRFFRINPPRGRSPSPTRRVSMLPP